ncbi:uncharacterized [Tachysurus ichikawai]
MASEELGAFPCTQCICDEKSVLGRPEAAHGILGKNGSADLKAQIVGFCSRTSQHSSLHYPQKIPHNLRLESHYGVNYRVDLQRHSASQKLILRIRFGERLTDGCLSYGRVLRINQ